MKLHKKKIKISKSVFFNFFFNFNFSLKKTQNYQNATSEKKSRPDFYFNNITKLKSLHTYKAYFFDSIDNDYNKEKVGGIRNNL